jgi:hypothetical protein
MKNAVFWDVAPCRSCVNRRFGGTYCLFLQGRKIREWGTSVNRWLQSETSVHSYLRENLKPSNIVIVISCARLCSTHFPILFCTSELKSDIRSNRQIPHMWINRNVQHATESAILLHNIVRFLTTKIVSYTSWSSCNQKVYGWSPDGSEE